MVEFLWVVGWGAKPFSCPTIEAEVEAVLYCIETFLVMNE